MLKKKREFIRKIIEKIEKNKKKEAITEYLQEREFLLRISKNDINEFENLDHQKFEKYLKEQMKKPDKIEHNELHKLKLEFFLNTNNILSLI